MNRKQQLHRAWVVSIGVCLVAGIYGAAMLFTQGHSLFHANDVMVWSLPLGVYIFLALSSSGLAMLSALPSLLGVRSLERSTKTLVFLSLATLCGGFAALVLEIGQITHMIYFIFSPNLSSPIWWMGAIYSFEFLLLVTKFWCLHTGHGESPLGKAAGTLSFFCALAAPMVLGAVFGMTESRPVYFGPMLSLYYLAMAFYSGTALFVLYRVACLSIEERQPPMEPDPSDAVCHRLFISSACVVALLTLLNTVVGNSTLLPEFAALKDYHRFAGLPLEGIIGIGVPLLLLMSSAVQRSRFGIMGTALLAWAGTLAIHMQILVSGQRVPVGPKAEQFPEFYAYTPSAWEWLVALFALAVMLFLYTLGRRYLNLDGELGNAA